jgi:hypothetical protein
MPTGNEAIISQVYGGDPSDVVAVFTATRDPSDPERIAGVSFQHSVNEVTRAVDKKLAEDFVRYGLDGKTWKKIALIGIPAALALAGSLGWWLSGRKRRR